MIHCVWLDACPNSVAEALVNGCPVIATDQGGTVELGVQTVIPDVAWGGRPVNLDKPPKVNIGLLAEAIRKHAQGRVPVDASHLQIGVIAKQYADFFRKVLNG
jgi:glycosyltransferase involved in cell wall biosynthesis